MADALQGLLGQLQTQQAGGLLSPAGQYPTANPYQGDPKQYGQGGEHLFFNGANGHPYGLPAFTGVQASSMFNQQSIADLIRQLFQQYAPQQGYQQNYAAFGGGSDGGFGGVGDGASPGGEPGGNGGGPGGNGGGSGPGGDGGGPGGNGW